MQSFPALATFTDAQLCRSSGNARCAANLVATFLAVAVADFEMPVGLEIGIDQDTTES